MKKSKLITVFAVALSTCILCACFPKGYTDKEEKAQINAAVALTEKYTDEYAPDAYISKRDFCVLDRQTEGNPKLYLTDWAEGKFKDSKNHKNYSVYVNTKTGEVYTDHNWDEVDSYGRKLFYEQFEDAYKMNFTLLGFLTLPYKDGDNSFGDITLSKMLPGDEETNESFVKDVFFGSDYEMTYYVDVSEDCDMDMFRNADISALGKKARLHVRQYSEDDFYKKTSQGGPEFIDETKVLATYDSNCPDEEKTKNSSEDNKQSDGDVPELTEDIYRCDPDEVFEAMSDWQFIFSSGAGGWATELSVNPDGTFSGLYCDDDMGDTGSGYENGTRYECDFTGRFNKKILTGGPLIYKLIIDEMNCEHKPGTEEIIDGVRHIYTEPYGLEGLTGREDALIFCDAGVVTQVFTEEEQQWLSSVGFGCYVGSDFDYIRDVPEELPFAALLNTMEDQAFYSQNRSEKNKTYLVNTVQLPGLHNEKSTKNSDGYYYVDGNDDGSFRVISTCFKTSKDYDEYNDADTFVYDSLKKIYGKDAPAKDDVYITSPKDAYDTDYWKMIISGNYSDYAVWYPAGEGGNISCSGRFTVVRGYEADTSYVYAYIIETDSSKRSKSYPDAGIGTYYISSLALTGKDEKLSSAGEGAGAIRSILCEMQTPGDGTVLAKEVIMVSESNKEFNEYRLADKSYTPFYIQYPKDKVHKLCFSYDLDSYMGEQSPDNTRLMQLYLNKDGEIVYAYEVYTP